MKKSFSPRTVPYCVCIENGSSMEVQVPGIGRCSRPTRANDASGDLLEQRLTALGHRLHDRRIVADDSDAIRAQLKTWIADGEVDIVIATGASPAIPPIPGLEDSAYSTSDSIWKLRELPKQLLIIGGGPIGCELAQAFRRLGSQVTILTRDPKVLPKEDRDLAELVLKNFERLEYFF